MLRDLSCAINSAFQISSSIGHALSSLPDRFEESRTRISSELLVRPESGAELGISLELSRAISRGRIVEGCRTLKEDFRLALQSELGWMSKEKQKWRLVTGLSTAANSPAINAWIYLPCV